MPGLVRQLVPPIVIVICYGLLADQFAGPALQPIVVVAVIYALFATSVGMSIGWAGVPTFGHAIFFGMGAYTAGLLRNVSLDSAVLLILSFVIGTVGGVVLFVIGGRKSVGLAFAMVTLAVGQVLREIASRVSLFGGENGLTGIVRRPFFGIPTYDHRAMLVYVIVVYTVVILGLRLLYVSYFGAALRASRDDALRAASCGLNVRLLKCSVFALSAGVAAVAGVLFAQDYQYVSASTFDYTTSGIAIIMIVIGGMYSFWGPSLGALVYTFVQWKLSSVSTQWFVYLGLAVIVIVLLRPDGLWSLVTALRRGAEWARGRMSNRVPSGQGGATS